jgi:hypothetical protein
MQVAGALNGHGCRCVEQVRGIKGSPGCRRAEWAQVQVQVQVCRTGTGASMGNGGCRCAEWVQACGTGAGTGMQKDRGAGAYMIASYNNSLKWQLSGSPQTVQNGPELSPKNFFSAGMVSGVLLKSGAVGHPTNLSVPPAAGGAPHLKEVWGAPHPVFAKCGLPHPKCGLPHREWGSL